MTTWARTFLVRNAHARTLLEYFWVSAVATVFAIRTFLYTFGYPQLGGGSLHIAHMLWGGLLMAVALLVMLAFLNREVRTFGAVIGGVGFGTFIDELGKFLTQDNNYFFQPTILLLYLIFVGLFFIVKRIELWFPLDKHEYLINSLELIKEVALHDLDTAEKKEALQYLRNASPDQKLTAVLLSALDEVEPLPLRVEGVATRFRRKMSSFYQVLVNNRLFAKSMIIVFAFASLDNFGLLILPSIRLATFSEWGLAIATSVSLIFIAQGAFYFRIGKRLRAFEALKAATIISIFLVQLFLFYVEQLSAAVELVGAVVSFQILQLLISQEKQLKAKKVETIRLELANRL